ncbi:MAG TPA: beta-galactosidase [Natronosporangium sp.]
MSRLVPRVSGLVYGGDYNPEQWPEQVWAEDAKLMREAGVNLATVGVFAWSKLEPSPGRYDFDWLDRVLDLLHQAGIAVDLATATAAPPPWFSHKYPETLPVTADGRRLSYGSRQAFCPSSPVYREAALGMAERLATRYAGHPALAMWHVHNEYGCQNPRCYCDVSAAAFRDWLRRRYRDLDELNEAWGTTFWSQRFSDWEQVQPPRATTTAPSSPSGVLDFQRFCSDALLELFVAERDLLHRLSPGVPVTTNLMVTGNFGALDYWRWAPELTKQDGLISTDHYIVPGDPIEPAAQVACGADRSRSLAGGPWLLMEHSTSSLSWRPRNFAKAPGQLLRNSLAHVARGSEGVNFFQWRASRYGAEKWHSAMLPHAGTDTKIWHEVVTLGGHLRRLAEIDGSTVRTDVAILLDHASGWAAEAPDQPSVDMTTFFELRRWHAALWRSGVVTDFAHPGADLSRYRLLLAPALYLLDDAAAANLAGFVAAGGTLVVGPYSGIVDEHDHVRLGGYPGALRDLLGVRVTEFFPLDAGEQVVLDNGWVGTIWTEHARVEAATVVAWYADGPVAGCPAVTRHPAGAGTAWYLGTRLADPDLATLLRKAGAAPLLPDAPPGLEAVRRQHPDGRSYLFLVNHAVTPATVAGTGTDLLTGTDWAGAVTVPAGEVVVLREGQ